MRDAALPMRAVVAVAGLFACAVGGCDNATVPDLPDFEPVPMPDPAGVDAVVFVVGDAGAAVEGRSPVLHALREDVEAWSEGLARDSAVSVIYAGDIVYPVGLRDRDHPDFPQDSARLWNQIRIVAGPAATRHATLGLFLAGNHDWGNATGDEGLERLQNLSDALSAARRGGPRVVLVPEPGSPGPVVRDLRRNVRLVFLDTHWFLQARSSEEKDAFFGRLAEALATAGERRVIMVQHHPYRSAGPHGALVPGPEALGIPFLLKKTGTVVQDLDSPVYDELRRRLRGTFRDTGRPPLVFAAGHDHSLQVLSGRDVFDPEHILVSGSGSKLTRITQTEGMRYGASRPGYAFLVFRADAAVDLFVVAGDPDRLTCDGIAMDEADVAQCMQAGVDSMDIAFSMNLVDPTDEGLPATLASEDAEPPSTPWWSPQRLAEPDGEAPESAPPLSVPRRRLLGDPDSVEARPGPGYPVGWLGRTLFGDLNRHLWDIPVRVPVLNLDSLGGGVTVEEVIDGSQTPGLRLRGVDGVLYQFRGIVESAGRLRPGPREGSALQGVLPDPMAARFPLSAAVVAELWETAGVLVAQPVPVVMPDDPRLGPHRESFAGRMGWIEVRPDEGEGTLPGFAGSPEITDSEELYRELALDPASSVNAPALLRARLVDMLVGDWDRPSDRWRWASLAEGERTRWEPVPRDPDWAFSRIDGLVPTVVGWIAGGYEGFSAEPPDVDRMTRSAERLERRLLGEMDRVDYLDAARELRTALTDSALAAAVEVLPEAYLASERSWLLEGLGARRDGLLDLADAWFELRAREVDVHGTAGVDVFEVDRSSTGDVTVRARTGSAVGAVRYERVFRPETTERVWIHWTEGEDRVVESGGSEGEIVVGYREFRPPGDP